MSTDASIAPALKALDQLRAEVDKRMGKKGGHLNAHAHALLDTVEQTLRMLQLNAELTQMAGGFDRWLLSLAALKGDDRQLALDLVSAGRRALAAKHHPDAGGDAARMAHLNAGADRLEQAVGRPEPRQEEQR